MEIIKTLEGTEATLKVIGRLDTLTSVDLEKEITEVVPQIDSLVFDFEELEYISSAGFRVLLATRNKSGKTLKIKILHLTEEVESLFEVTGFCDIFTIE
ncbi:MAG: STAS domain-containing protein [Lachnospiraceae bacterium]|nr:STAS domain-containing protein [Lachnospiraceae bacterium]